MKKLLKKDIVFSAIKDKIDTGKFLDGDRLPPVRVLAKEFNVSDVTIVNSFELLEKENLITRVQKSGVFVGTKNKNKLMPYNLEPAKQEPKK
jgi:DNA-binding GntR family transcriptional regulator